jgi:hypothetical protein
VELLAALSDLGGTVEIDPKLQEVFHHEVGSQRSRRIDGGS